MMIDEVQYRLFVKAIGDYCDFQSHRNSEVAEIFDNIKNILRDFETRLRAMELLVYDQAHIDKCKKEQGVH